MKFEMAEIKIEKFEIADVITASGDVEIDPGIGGLPVLP